MNETKIYDGSNVGVLIAARNEAWCIDKTIKAIYAQTYPISVVVLVNDSSKDGTEIIASQMGVNVLYHFPPHLESYIARPELASIWNTGLKLFRDRWIPKYLLLMGAEHILPNDYLERLVDRMEADKTLGVCSGRIEGEDFEKATPRGSGRLVRADLWNLMNHLEYPVVWGWESWLLFRFRKEGFKVECFEDVSSRLLRPTALTGRKVKGQILGMKALGYPWKFRFAKTMYQLGRHPKFLRPMLSAWWQSRKVEPLEDVSEYVRANEGKAMSGKLKRRLGV